MEWRGEVVSSAAAAGEKMEFPVVVQRFFCRLGFWRKVTVMQVIPQQTYLVRRQVICVLADLKCWAS